MVSKLLEIRSGLFILDPDPGVKKAPDPGSAPLVKIYSVFRIIRLLKRYGTVVFSALWRFSRVKETASGELLIWESGEHTVPLIIGTFFFINSWPVRAKESRCPENFIYLFLLQYEKAIVRKRESCKKDIEVWILPYA